MFQRIKTFIEEARQELRRVNWPTREETIQLTLVVVGIAIAIAAFLGIFDYLFLFGLKTFLKLKR